MGIELLKAGIMTEKLSQDLFFFADPHLDAQEWPCPVPRLLLILYFIFANLYFDVISNFRKGGRVRDSYVAFTQTHRLFTFCFIPFIIFLLLMITNTTHDFMGTIWECVFLYSLT